MYITRHMTSKRLEFSKTKNILTISQRTWQNMSNTPIYSLEKINECIWLSYTGNTSHIFKCNKNLSTRIEHWCRESILPISARLPRDPIWHLENSWCRCLNFLLIYRRRKKLWLTKTCKYYYGMTRADFINRF